MERRLKEPGSNVKIHSLLFVARKDFLSGLCVKPQPCQGNGCDLTKLKSLSYSRATWSSYVEAYQRPPISESPSIKMGLSKPSVIFRSVAPESGSTKRT